MTSKVEIARNWLPRYTGTEYGDFGEWILLTNFHDYEHRFADRFGCEIQGQGGAMTSATMVKNPGTWSGCRLPKVLARKRIRRSPPGPSR